MFLSYIEMLQAVEKTGEFVSPSSVSLNRTFATMELSNVQVKIDNFKPQLVDDNEVEYLQKEIDWYLGRNTSDDQHKKLKILAKELIGCVNRAGPNSNYGEMCLRLKNHIGLTQLDWILGKLVKDKSSRQAVAFYNTPNYQYWSNDDFVCTLTQMFSIKDGKLNTTVNIRSNDLVNCFRFDSIWYNMFQSIVLKELKKTYPDLQKGWMLCNIFSAHCYLKDKEKLQKIYRCAEDISFKTLGEEYL